MTRARVTRPLIAANSANPPSAHPSTSKNFGERTRRLLNERAAAAASTDDNRMVIAKNRPVEVDPTPPARHFFRCRLLPQVSGNSRGCFYLEMRSIHITVPVQWVGRPHVQARKVKNDNKYAKKTAVELDGKISMNAELSGKFITQQVAAVMADKTKQYENKIKTGKRWKVRALGELAKNGKRVGGDASKKKKTSTTQTTTNSKTPKQYLSRLEQFWKSILTKPSRERNQEADNADSSTPGIVWGSKLAGSKSALRSTKQTSKKNGAKSRGHSKKEWRTSMASFQMIGARQNKIICLSWPLCKSGFTYVDPPTFTSTISRLTKLPQ